MLGGEAMIWGEWADSSNLEVSESYSCAFIIYDSPSAALPYLVLYLQC